MPLCTDLNLTRCSGEKRPTTFTYHIMTASFNLLDLHNCFVNYYSTIWKNRFLKFGLVNKLEIPQSSYNRQMSSKKSIISFNYDNLSYDLQRSVTV